jgi:hypothetical protein
MCGKLPRYNTTQLCSLWIFFGGNLKIEHYVGPIIKCPADPCKPCLHFFYKSAKISREKKIVLWENFQL